MQSIMYNQEHEPVYLQSKLHVWISKQSTQDLPFSNIMIL